MAKRKKKAVAEGVPRIALTAEESLKRMQAFRDRKERFVAVVRKGKDRVVPG